MAGGRLGSLWVSVQARTAKFEKGMKRVQRSMRGVQRTAGRVKQSLAGMVGVIGAGLIFRKVIMTIAGFEESMARLRAVVRPTAKEFVALNKRARELGATTRFTASEVADAMLQLARKGLNVKKIMAALPHVLDLASAGELELAEAADVSSSALQQFTLKAEAMQRVGDAMVIVANRAGTDVRQLAEAFKDGALAASTAGMSVEQTAAAMGTMGDAAIRGGEAGTKLRNILLALSKITPESDSVLRSIGLDYRKGDVSVMLHGWEEVMRRLQGMAKLADPLAAAGLVFQKRTAVAALAAIKGADKFRTLTGALKENRGEMKKVALMVEDTLAGAYRSLRSAIEDTFLIQGDKGLGGALRKMTDNMTEAIRILNDAPGAFENASEGGRRMAETITDIGKALAAVGRGINTIKLAWANLRVFDAMNALSAADGPQGNPFTVSKRRVELLEAKIDSMRALGALRGPQTDAIAILESQIREEKARIGSILKRQGLHPQGSRSDMLPGGTVPVHTDFGGFAGNPIARSMQRAAEDAALSKRIGEQFAAGAKAGTAEGVVAGTKAAMPDFRGALAAMLGGTAPAAAGGVGGALGRLLGGAAGGRGALDDPNARSSLKDMLRDFREEAAILSIVDDKSRAIKEVWFDTQRTLDKVRAIFEKLPEATQKEKVAAEELVKTLEKLQLDELDRLFQQAGGHTFFDSIRDNLSGALDEGIVDGFRTGFKNAERILDAFFENILREAIAHFGRIGGGENGVGGILGILKGAVNVAGGGNFAADSTVTAQVDSTNLINSGVSTGGEGVRFLSEPGSASSLSQYKSGAPA